MSADYGWIITWESPEIFEGLDLPSRVGWVGPRNIDPVVEERLRAGEGVEFQLKSDDEGEGDFHDYSGRIIVLDNADEEAEFGPLDDLGTPDVGSTTIEYMVDGVWTPL